MRTLIAVPSKDRFRNHQILKNTWSWLKYSNKYPHKIFVEPQDYAQYCKVLGEENVIDIRENNRGLGFVKRFIKKYAEQHGYEFIFKLDDDIMNLRNQHILYRGLKLEKKDRQLLLNHLLDDSEIMFDAFENIGAVALAYGGGVFKTEEYDTWMKMDVRLNTAYIVRTELFHPDTSIEINVFEDFYTFINMMSLGFQTILYGNTGIDCELVGKNEGGGHQSFDRRQQCVKEKQYIEQVFPNIKWKQVKNKGWDFEPDFRRSKL